MKQMTLATAGFERYSKATRRAEFMVAMDRVVPWGRFCAFMSLVYPQAGNGRPPIELERMIRILCVQHWFILSAPALEESLFDSVSMCRFVGINLGRESVPDETTVCKFRHRRTIWAGKSSRRSGDTCRDAVSRSRRARLWMPPSSTPHPRPRTRRRRATPRCARPRRAISGISA